jgi:hypothetical protein
LQLLEIPVGDKGASPGGGRAAAMAGSSRQSHFARPAPKVEHGAQRHRAGSGRRAFARPAFDLHRRHIEVHVALEQANLADHQRPALRFVLFVSPQRRTIDRVLVDTGAIRGERAIKPASAEKPLTMVLRYVHTNIDEGKDSLDTLPGGNLGEGQNSEAKTA